MTKRRTIAGLAAVLLAHNGFAIAQVSQEFSGVWLATQNNQNSLKCKKADWEAKENDGLINIAKGNVEYWESSCDVSSFQLLKSQKGSAEVVLTCGGEGYSWRTREIWSLQTIEARRALITVQLQASKQRDEAKGPSTKMQSEIFTRIYMACE